MFYPLKKLCKYIPTRHKNIAHILSLMSLIEKFSAINFIYLFIPWRMYHFLHYNLHFIAWLEMNKQ